MTGMRKGLARSAANAAQPGPQLAPSEVNCLGPFSDAKPAQCQALRFMAVNDPALEGAFKTPSLRGIAQRAPYMHAGQLASLQDGVQRSVRAPVAAVGHTERSALRLTVQEVKDLVVFLGTL